MKQFYTPFIYLAAGMVAIAAAIRLTWELLEPAVVPVTVLIVLTLIARFVWLRTNRF